MKLFLHSSYCESDNCGINECDSMKNKLSHVKICHTSWSENHWCDCKRLISLSSFHAAECDKLYCTVPFCSEVKKKGQEELQTMLTKAFTVKKVCFLQLIIFFFSVY